MEKEERVGNRGVWQESLHSAKHDECVDVCGTLGNRVTFEGQFEAALRNAFDRLSGNARKPHRFRLDLNVGTRRTTRLFQTRQSGGSALPPLWCRQADNLSAFKLVQPTF